MKIGLLTPHYAYNYGAVLQAFALLVYLQRLGHEVLIINRRPQWLAAIPSFWGRCARKLQELTQGRNFLSNESVYLQPQTEPIIALRDVDKIKTYHFDAIIVGSDQVWRDDYIFTTFGYNIFLDFLDSRETRKIAYAPSFGKDTWQQPEVVRRRVETLLHDFYAISVREASGIRICADLFHVHAFHVLDPSLLLNGSDYIRLYGLNVIKYRQPYLAAYILDCDIDKQRIVHSISSQLGVKARCILIFQTTNKISRFTRRFFPILPPVKEWLENIMNARFVVTNSFHGMVFSLIFRKQFIVYGNKTRGMERFKSFLNIFGLEDRLLDWHDNFNDQLNRPICYEKIDPIIKEWQQRSYEFINQALNES